MGRINCIYISLKEKDSLSKTNLDILPDALVTGFLFQRQELYVYVKIQPPSDDSTLVQRSCSDLTLSVYISSLI